ncbi:MAG: ornithine cyclodeaminase family protein, partial [Tissierellia bacterium]|nr:ornithine cyclodeaminase family protein [Tissierellia bacterium]
MTKSLIITQQEIMNNLDLKEVIDSVERTYYLYGKGEIIMPTKITLDMEPLGSSNWFISMPAYIKPMDVVGIKFIGGFNANKEIGLPYIMSQILLNDPKTGVLRALMDGNLITNMRTGAQSPVFAKYLASKSDILTIIGAGVQGRATALSMVEIFDFKEIRVSDLDRDARKRFIEEVGNKTSSPILAYDSVEEAVRGADIIVTATTASTPIVYRDWVKPGAVISSIGSDQELDEELILQADKRYVDHMEQNLDRGEFHRCFEKGSLGEDDITGEIGDVICGKVVGRESNDEIIIASPIGMGCLDIAIAAIVYDRVSG